MGGPWPGRTVVVPSKLIRREEMLCRNWFRSAKGKSVRPIDPRKSVSPEKINFSFLNQKAMCPGACPGVARHWH